MTDIKIDHNDLRMMYEYMLSNVDHINHLAKQGDAEAIIVQLNYRNFYRNKLNVHAQNEFVVSVQEFMKRDLTIATREILQNRFGHKLPR